MAKILAYVFSDHHAGGGYPSRGIDDSPHMMEQIIDLALKAKAGWLISLGDAVNSARTHADAPVPLKNQLRRAVKAGLKFGYIDGNHDKRGTSWLDDPDFTHLHGKTLPLGGRVWHGADFMPREECQEFLANGVPQEVDSLFMHQAWGDLLGFEGRSQCDFSDIPEHVTALLTGDCHAECMIEDCLGEQGHAVKVCSPGSTSIQSIVEPQEKYIVALEDSEDNPFRRVRLKSRELLRSDILHTVDDLDKFLAMIVSKLDSAYARAASLGVHESMWKPLLHVTHSSTLEGLTRRVIRMVGDKAHLFWREIPPQPEDGEFTPSLAAFTGDAFTPLTMLKQEINPEDPEEPAAKEAYALAEQLYHCKDRAAVMKDAKAWLEAQVTQE